MYDKCEFYMFFLQLLQDDFNLLYFDIEYLSHY